MEKLIEQMLKAKIVVIVRGVAREKLILFAQAAYDGGIRFLECTYDASGKTPDVQIADNIRMLAEHFGDKMVIGAGTVLTCEQVRLTKEAGGKFIISPDTNSEIIRETKKLEMLSIPGAITPTEVAAASRAGADFVKVFPVDLYGPKYIKTLSAPLSHVRMLAVNGITADNMTDYLEAGACGVGVGSGIVNKKLIKAGDFAAITELAKHYTSKI